MQPLKDAVSDKGREDAIDTARVAAVHDKDFISDTLYTLRYSSLYGRVDQNSDDKGTSR